MGFWDWLQGNNDFQAPNTNIASTGYGGSTPGYTEEQYQQHIQQQQYYLSHPEEMAKLHPSVRASILRAPESPESMPYQAQEQLTRKYTNPLLASLALAAEGKGPSQAQDALREGTATTVASQYGAAASPSVGGAAQAALYANAQNNAGAAMQSGARQAAQLRAQEMSDARQQLGQTIGQTSGQFMTQAQLNLEREKANQGAQGQMAGLSQKTGEENRGGIANIWHQALSSDIRAKEDVKPLSSFSSTVGDVLNAPQAMNPFDLKQYFSEGEEKGPAVAPAKSAGFLAGLFSDERSKEKIRSLEGALAESRRTADTIAGTQIARPDAFQYGQGSSGLKLSTGPGGGNGIPTRRFEDLATPEGSRAALGPVKPYEYRYKPEFAAAMGTDRSPRAGVMAQDLERSPNPALRSAVIDTPMGKAIEPKRAISANLALSAGLDKRLRNIEQGMAAPVQYPNLVMSDKDSKETIRVLSEALAAKPQPAAQQVATGAPQLFPDGSRLVTPMEDSERKVARMRAGIPDPYGEQRTQIENAATAIPVLRRWDSDSMDPDYELQGRMPAPRMY